MTTDDRRPTFARRVALALLWLAPASSGCGGSGATVPVFQTAGQVLFQGKPLEGVQVAFHPLAAGAGRAAPVAVAKTDQDGKFHLVTAVGADGQTIDGAPAGEYAVALTPPGRSDSRDFLNKGTVKAAPDPIGKRYADAKTSGLKATIKPGPNTLEPFDLKESGGAAPTSVPSGGRDR
jgi:hypothetical protein